MINIFDVQHKYFKYKLKIKNDLRENSIDFIYPKLSKYFVISDASATISWSFIHLK